MNAENLKVWLPFDESTTLDKCGNTWTTYGTPSISDTNAINGKALQLDGSSYLRTENIELGGRDFAIDGWLYMNSTTPAQACIVLLEKEQGYPLLHIGKVSTNPKRLSIGVNPASDVSTERSDSSYLTTMTNTEVVNKRVHFELDYHFSEQLLEVYINGARACFLRNIVPQFERMNFTLTLGYFYRTWGSDTDREYFFKGSLDELRIFDGSVLHTQSFTPPSTAEYEELTPPAKNISLYFDVERVITGFIHANFTADVQRKILSTMTFSADVERRIIAPFEFVAAVEICDVIPVEFDADINRAIKAKVKLFAVDNTEYFSTIEPTVIPPQETIPAAVDNTVGLQSIEISLSEQQLTDNISFVGVVPFDIMFPVQGQYLDYVFDMRVERVQQHGILYSCDCCVDASGCLGMYLALEAIIDDGDEVILQAPRPIQKSNQFRLHITRDKLPQLSEKRP